MPVNAPILGPKNVSNRSNGLVCNHVPKRKGLVCNQRIRVCLITQLRGINENIQH